MHTKMLSGSGRHFNFGWCVRAIDGRRLDIVHLLVLDAVADQTEDEVDQLGRWSCTIES
jgi:hypothetical protein